MQTPEQRVQVTSSELSSALRRIEDDLSLRPDASAAAAIPKSGTAPNLSASASFSMSQSASSHSVQESSVPLVCLPRASEARLPVEQPETLFGLTEKMAATESTVFLAKQFTALTQHIDEFLPEEQRNKIQEYQTKVRGLLSLGLRYVITAVFQLHFLDT